eukprot:3789884-Ditylum_brightwellii.AAC.1
MADGEPPEIDKTGSFDDENHQIYQMLIAMLNWTEYKKYRVVVNSRDTVIEGGHDMLYKDFAKEFREFY